MREYRNWLLCLSEFSEHSVKIITVLADVSSLFICRQEIYVCLRKQMIALIVR